MPELGHTDFAQVSGVIALWVGLVKQERADSQVAVVLNRP